MKNIFTEHPRSVNESYLQHMAFALRYSFCLFACSIAAFIHGFLPFMFTTYASKKIEWLVTWVKTRD